LLISVSIGQVVLCQTKNLFTGLQHSLSYLSFFILVSVGLDIELLLLHC